MSKQVAVTVSGIDFAAAHFVSEGGKCELLHGHNYHVTATIWGELNHLGMVIDFRVLKQHLRQLCKQWDHLILLPSNSKLIKVSQQDNQTKVETSEGTYSFPAKNVEILNVVETTAEELARIFCKQLLGNITKEHSNISQVRVELAESSTSRAIVTMLV
ncbi:MAG: 6-pyruvoyl tetrahydropterin synthase family protein [Candidatus Odinarchaeota archaeon]